MRTWCVTFMLFSISLALLACTSVSAPEFTPEDGATPANTPSPQESVIIPPPSATMVDTGWNRVESGERGIDLSRIRMEDVLEVTVYAASEKEAALSGDFKVSQDGSISFGYVGPVEVVGRSVREARQTLERSLVRILNNATVSVAIKAYSPRTAKVFGALDARPEADVDLTKSRTLIDVLVAAGWTPVSDKANTVTLRRGGDQRVIGLKSLLQGSSNSNPEVNPGDLVILNPASPITVSGSVSRPLSFTIGVEERITIYDALLRAGGLTMVSNPNHVRIVNPDGASTAINLVEVIKGSHLSNNPYIYAGQTLVIPELANHVYYAFGMTTKNGAFESHTQLTIVQFLATVGVKQFGAVTDDARLVRGYPESPEAYRLNIDRILDGDASGNVLLKDGDVLFLPESNLSEALEVFTRIMAPLSPAASTIGTIVSDAKDIRDFKEKSSG